MAGGDPGNERVIIEHAGGMLRITIPAAARSLTVIVMLLWLCIWPFGEFKAVRDLIGGSENGLLFTIIFLAGWTLAGVFVAYALLWQLTGQEIIELTQSTLRYHKHVSVFGRGKEYAVARITNLRAVRPVHGYDAEGNKTNGLENGAIAFDYGLSTHRMGLSMDEGDAKQVVAELCQRATSLCGSGMPPQGRH